MPAKRRRTPTRHNPGRRKLPPARKTVHATRPLNERERRFVEAYMGEAAGNGTLAAELAGYKGSKATLAAIASENLRKPKIRAAIDQRVSDDPKVKTRQELQQFWSTVTDDRGVKMKDRLKASELLGKSQAAFTERHEHTATGAEVHFYLPDNGKRPAEQPDA